MSDYRCIEIHFDEFVYKLTKKTFFFRYTASMQDPPRGTYYPAGGIGAMQQPRQYQYSATNPWQREEREKVIKSHTVIYCILKKL